MDALKYLLAKSDPSKGIDEAGAVRYALAHALRDLADEIEAGDRSLRQIQTFEQVTSGEYPVSILYLATQTKRMPAAASS